MTKQAYMKIEQDVSNFNNALLKFQRAFNKTRAGIFSRKTLGDYAKEWSKNLKYYTTKFNYSKLPWYKRAWHRITNSEEYLFNKYLVFERTMGELRRISTEQNKVLDLHRGNVNKVDNSVVSLVKHLPQASRKRAIKCIVINDKLSTKLQNAPQYKNVFHKDSKNIEVLHIKYNDIDGNEPPRAA